MANIKISELNSLTEKDYTDVLPIVDTSANETKKISIEELINNNVSLVAVSSTAPSECVVGDKYYNTEDNRIYTATATDTWSDSGEEPIEGIFYIVFDKQSTYAYDGETLVSVGGGAGGGGSVEIGTIVPFAGSTAPDSFLMCDGSAISRTTYADLFAVIGTTYGAGDGSTTFNLPNLKGRVPVGLDGTQTEFDTLGETGGSKYLQEHTHNFKISASLGTAGSTGGYMGGIAGSVDTLVESAGTGDSGNLQPYIVVNYIIKAKKITPTEAQVVNTYSESTSDAYSCDYVNDNFQTKGTLLWTNTDITQSFAPQTITFNDNYLYYDIIISQDAGILKSQRVYAGDQTVPYILENITGGYMRIRPVYVASNSLVFDNGTFYSAYASGASNNSQCIPYKIIGYK